MSHLDRRVRALEAAHGGFQFAQNYAQFGRTGELPQDPAGALEVLDIIRDRVAMSLSDLGADWPDDPLPAELAPQVARLRGVLAAIDEAVSPDADRRDAARAAIRAFALEEFAP